MNIAVIIAGGVGQRTGQDIPKQFLNVFDRPVVIYTLEAFQNHPEIDAIEVVCLDGWHEMLKVYAKQFGITKLKWIVSGGENGQSSIRNGIMNLKNYCDLDDIILVHDAIRPMVSQEIISDCIVKCRVHGSGVASIPCAEAMLQITGDETSDQVFPREKLMRTQTPQAFKLNKLLWAHDEALKQGITESVASCTLMVELGEKVYFSKGSEKNLKITTVEDIDIFKALYKSKRDEWLK